MHDLIVIGGGFWGSATTILAQDRGMDVLLLDDEHPMGASRNAAGLCHPEWYKATAKTYMPDRWQQHDVHESIDWIRHRWGGHLTNEITESYYKPGRISAKHGMILVDDFTIMLREANPQPGHITRVTRNRTGWTAHTSGNQEHQEHQAKAIVIAAGCWTDTILRTSGFDTVGVTPLVGRALVVESRSLRTDAPITRYARPYTHYTIRPWQETAHWRVGDTVEGRNTDTLRPGAIGELWSFIRDYMPDAEHVRELQGWRPITRNGMIVEKIDDGLVVATGGHRVGLGLSYLAANDAIRLQADR